MEENVQCMIFKFFKNKDYENNPNETVKKCLEFLLVLGENNEP
jgi:hypothetical protein